MFSLFAVSTLACLSNPESTTYNLTKFEEEILPKWIAQYQLSHSLDGHFSFRPGSKVAHPYATSDVAHVLCFTNQLDEVVPTESVRVSLTTLRAIGLLKKIMEHGK